jgi:hypothetical protein
LDLRSIAPRLIVGRLEPSKVKVIVFNSGRDTAFMAGETWTVPQQGSDARALADKEFVKYAWHYGSKITRSSAIVTPLLS